MSLGHDPVAKEQRSPYAHIFAFYTDIQASLV